ncbi:tetratricopeptide repeat protein [Bacteroides thetaiotaomicron]|nr:tetratricopeptide repeat protein [Bacteroides thetaiotaomicron]
MSLGYGKLKKYAKALEVQKKAYEIIKTLYPHNKAQLGTNYLLMTLNTSIAYYQNSNNAEALKFLQEAENIANELKELNQAFQAPTLLLSGLPKETFWPNYPSPAPRNY